jgi:hypothetical protein
MGQLTEQTASFGLSLRGLGRVGLGVGAVAMIVVDRMRNVID